MDSILTSVKEMVGAGNSGDAFDTELIVHINSVFMILQQIGVGPPEGFFITGDTETWDTFLQTSSKLLGAKTFMFLKVKLLFDPPSSSFVLAAMKEQADEYESRLNMAAEGGF